MYTRQHVEQSGMSERRLSAFGNTARVSNLRDRVRLHHQELRTLTDTLKRLGNSPIHRPKDKDPQIPHRHL